MKKLKRILNVKTIQLRLRCIQGVIRKKREKEIYKDHVCY